MAVNLSPVGGVAAQFFDNNGVILSGGKIFTYAAGTTTNQVTYTSASGATAHSNPIILDSAGRVPSGEIWLTDGLAYKFVLKNANDVLIGTYDNIVGINSTGTIDSSSVTYDPPFTNSEATTVENKLAQTVSIKDFGAVGDGVVDDTTSFISFIEYLSDNNVQGYCPSGIYLFSVQHIEFVAKNNISVVCDMDATFRDAGRLITGANGNINRIPWGIEFVNCNDIQWVGGLFETSGTGYTGSSTGFFNASNYTLRKPVLGFYTCDNVKLYKVKQSGNPSVGIAAVDRDVIISSLGLTPTPAEYAYFTLRSAFLNMYDTTNIVVEDQELVADTCAREQLTFVDCEYVNIVRPKSISVGNNFVSMGKVIGCNNVVLSQCQVVDTGTGSLWDFIGKNITFCDTQIDYPNGKLCDISHEWGPANQPSDNIVVTDCSTTGQGVTNVTGSSTTAQVVNNPITNVTIRNIRVQTSKTNWTSDVEWVRLPTVSTYTIHDGYVENGSIGFTHSNNGGAYVALYGLRFRWTVATGSISVNGRTFTFPTQGYFFNCDIDADATGSGLTTLAIAGGVGIPVKFIGCVINDTVFETSNPAVEFIDCVINSSSISASGGGSYKYTNCVIDGVRQSGSTTGATTSFRNFSTSIVDGNVYGGLNFIGDDGSTGAAGTRASFAAVAHGATGQAHFEFLTSASGTSAQSTVYFYAADGSPEGVFTAPVGSLYLNTAGGASTTLYVKTSGTGNTGWTAK